MGLRVAWRFLGTEDYMCLVVAKVQTAAMAMAMVALRSDNNMSQHFQLIRTKTRKMTKNTWILKCSRTSSNKSVNGSTIMTAAAPLCPSQSLVGLLIVSLVGKTRTS